MLIRKLSFEFTTFIGLAAMVGLSLSLPQPVLAMTQEVGWSVIDEVNEEFQTSRFSPADRRDILERELALIDLKPESSRTGRYLKNVAFGYDELNDKVNAEEYLRRSLSAMDRYLGNDEPEAMSTLRLLAQIEVQKQNFSAAVRYLRRALHTTVECFGENDPHTGQVLEALADVYRYQKQFDLSEETTKRLIAVFEALRESSTLREGTSRDKLAELYFEQKQFAKAEKLYLAARDSYVKTLGPNSISVATLWDKLADVYFKQHRYKQCEDALRKSIVIKEISLGKTNEYLITTLRQYTVLLKTTGRLSQAAETQARVDRIQKAYPIEKRPALF